LINGAFFLRIVVAIGVAVVMKLVNAFAN